MASQLTEPIIIKNVYSIKSYPFGGHKLNVYLSKEQQNEIRRTFRKQYPFGAPGKDIIKKHIKNNSCGYCLCYGHIIDPTVFPPTCPNLESDYGVWLIEMARKYHADLRIMNFHVMTGIGITPSKYANGIPNWSRSDFEKQLCKKYPRYKAIINEPTLTLPQNVFVDNPSKIPSKL